MKKADFIEDIRQRATHIAKHSGMNHRHGALVIYDGKIISHGYNHEHPALKNQYSIHAEVDALTKIKKLGKHVLSKCELVVVRIGPESFNNVFKLSMPCCNCTKYIQRLGIKKVYYSTNDEFDNHLRMHEDYTDSHEHIIQMREKHVEKDRLTKTTNTRYASPELSSPVSSENMCEKLPEGEANHGRSRRLSSPSRNQTPCVPRRRAKSV